MSCVPWPEDWPDYHNGSELCDMLIGPCSCGASHQPGEFRFDGTFLYRYKKVVRQTQRGDKMQCIPWPEDWPKYYNGGILCDILVGLCGCGTTHQLGEFRFDGTYLCRNGLTVCHKDGIINDSTLEELKKQRNKLETKIKKLQTIEAVEKTAAFKIRFVSANGLQELCFNATRQVSRLKYLLVELLDE